MLDQDGQVGAGINVVQITRNTATCSEDGGFGGKLDIALWSDTSGHLAQQFDLFDAAECQCLEGVVVIDEAGQVRGATLTPDWSHGAEY